MAVRRAHPRLNNAAWLRQQYEDGGRSIRDVAAELGVAPRTVRLTLADHGIVLRRRGRPALCDADLDDAVVTLYGEGRSMQATADALGLTEDSVRARLLRLGEPIRRRGGRRPPDAEMPPELRDPAWLRQQYVEQGVSLRRIASELKVSTRAVRTALARAEVRRPRRPTQATRVVMLKG